jgi:hypothetical protein
MVYGLWFMVYGLWFMVYGLWFMVYGLWFMVYGVRFMAALPALVHAGLVRREVVAAVRGGLRHAVAQLLRAVAAQVAHFKANFEDQDISHFGGNTSRSGVETRPMGQLNDLNLYSPTTHSGRTSFSSACITSVSCLARAITASM